MKYALVTGGSRGIGRAVCVKLAQMGYHIIINYVSNATEAQKTLELVRQAGQDGEILMFDVSNRQQTSKAIESWENAHPEDQLFRSKGSHHSRHESTGSGGSTQKCDCQRCRPWIYQNRYGRGTRRRYTEENHSSQSFRYSRGSGRTGWLSGFAKRRLHYR